MDARAWTLLVVLSVCTVGFVRADASLKSLNNFGISIEWERESDGDFALKHGECTNPISYMFFDGSNEHHAILNQGLVVGPSRSERPGAIRLKNNSATDYDLEGYVRGEWLSLSQPNPKRIPGFETVGGCSGDPTDPNFCAITTPSDVAIQAEIIRNLEEGSDPFVLFGHAFGDSVPPGLYQCVGSDCSSQASSSFEELDNGIFGAPSAVLRFNSSRLAVLGLTPGNGDEVYLRLLEIEDFTTIDNACPGSMCTTISSTASVDVNNILVANDTLIDSNPNLIEVDSALHIIYYDTSNRTYDIQYLYCGSTNDCTYGTLNFTRTFYPVFKYPSYSHRIYTDDNIEGLFNDIMLASESSSTFYYLASGAIAASSRTHLPSPRGIQIVTCSEETEDLPYECTDEYIEFDSLQQPQNDYQPFGAALHEDQLVIVAAVDKGSRNHRWTLELIVCTPGECASAEPTMLLNSRYLRNKGLSLITDINLRNLDDGGIAILVSYKTAVESEETMNTVVLHCAANSTSVCSEVQFLQLSEYANFHNGAVDISSFGDEVIAVSFPDPRIDVSNSPVSQTWASHTLSPGASLCNLGNSGKMLTSGHTVYLCTLVVPADELIDVFGYTNPAIYEWIPLGNDLESTVNMPVYHEQSWSGGSF